MKRLQQALVAASFIALPFTSHAADNTSLTRDQVRADLIRAEQAGQYPQSHVHYPDAAPSSASVYAANRAANKATASDVSRSSYGPSTSGSFAAGARRLGARLSAGVHPVVPNIYQGG